MLFRSYEQARINVTLTASMKSLKGQAKEFIDKIVDDLKLIETQQYKAEILVEYKNTLNVSNAITTAMNRVEAIEIEKRKQEEIVNQSIEEEKAEIQEAIKPFEQAVRQDMKIHTITFKVTDNAIRLKQLKDYLIREGYQYE